MDRPQLIALLAGDELRAPAVGMWRSMPAPGSFVTTGTPIGTLEVLGMFYRLVAPAGAHGMVAESPRGAARVPVGYGERLVLLDADVSGAAVARTEAAAVQAASTTGLALRAPTSGRFYRRPGPGKEPFVSDGDEIGTGQTVCLLEVMKTFNRVVYGADGLPERARIVSVVPEDGADLDAGDVILDLEAV